MKKIDTEKSIIYRYDRLSDLARCVEILGENGYFSDETDFSDYATGTLIRVVCWLEKTEYPFVYRNEESTDTYSYFIPENKVVFKEEPKQYRPYKDIAEFANSMGLRDSDKVQFIGFRSKDCSNSYNLAYNGYEVDKFGVAYIHLGSLTFTFDELFTHYEYELNSFEWLPFGIEE